MPSKIRKQRSRFKQLLPLLGILIIAYIAVGDRYIRQPYGAASTQIRTGILRMFNIGVSSAVETLPQDPRGANRDRALEEAGQAIPKN
ncbi:MAG: hypothetical protein HC924_06335 [Synechococcaceae cyanobacterium SM2_3_2]|nr:hypothetical protein [Synechococcaceae cyanobacterium SM2_3_2]